MTEGRYGRGLNEVRSRGEDQLEETGGRRSSEALEAAEEEEEEELEEAKDEERDPWRYMQKRGSRAGRGHERHLGASKFRLPVVLAGYLPPIACPV